MKFMGLFEIWNWRIGWGFYWWTCLSLGLLVTWWICKNKTSWWGGMGCSFCIHCHDGKQIWIYITSWFLAHMHIKRWAFMEALAFVRAISGTFFRYTVFCCRFFVFFIYTHSYFHKERKRKKKKSKNKSLDFWNTICSVPWNIIYAICMQYILTILVCFV